VTHLPVMETQSSSPAQVPQHRRRARSASTRRPKAPKGFSLIEVMVSSALLLLALAGTLSGMSTAIRLHANQRQATVALHVAEAELESLIVARQADARLDLGVRADRHFNSDGLEVASASQFLLVTTVTPLSGIDLKQVQVVVSWNNLGTPRRVILKTMRG